MNIQLPIEQAQQIRNYLTTRPISEAVTAFLWVNNAIAEAEKAEQAKAAVQAKRPRALDQIDEEAKQAFYDEVNDRREKRGAFAEADNAVTNGKE